MPTMTEAQDEAIRDITKMVEEFIRESMSDPDIVAQSQDYRDGYARGFGEAALALSASLIKRVST